MEIYVNRFLEFKKSDYNSELTELNFVENELINLESYFEFHDEENVSIRKLMLHGFEMITNIELGNQYRNYLLYKREVLMLELQNQIRYDKDSIKILQFENELNKLKDTNELEFFDYDKDIFKNQNAFKLFLEFNKTITKPYIDFSFIFQQMKNDKLIYNLKHKRFIEWLVENNFIKGKDVEQFIIIGELRTLKKSTSETRLNIYLNLKERFIID